MKIEKRIIEKWECSYYNENTHKEIKVSLYGRKEDSIIIISVGDDIIELNPQNIPTLIIMLSRSLRRARSLHSKTHKKTTAMNNA